jgi:hypothetical protein
VTFTLRVTASRAVWIAVICAATAPGARAQVVQRNAQFRLPAGYNFAFYDTYPDAARSFYAAHFAHFGIYEVLYRSGPGDSAALGRLERMIRDYIARPPRLEPPAEIIAPSWAKIAWRTASAMDWTHMLHSQLYDILTDDRVMDKRAAGERAIAYYLSNPDAFSTRGYGHAFMLGGGPWAATFSATFPSLNGILWAYHWHHAAVYEALMEPDAASRAAALERVLGTFRDSVLADPPRSMPLTAEIAPRFSAMFPAAAHIFDNLHMMHDVVNDIMADTRISLDQKGTEIGRMLGLMGYRGQDTVVPPETPAHAHGHMPAMRPPTRLPDGRWLPQGHPAAREHDHERREDEP